jgi:hypothetical protein
MLLRFVPAISNIYSHFPISKSICNLVVQDLQIFIWTHHLNLIPSCSHRTHILLLFMIMYSDQNNSYYNHPNSFQSIYLFLHLMNGTEGKQQLVFRAWFCFFLSTRIGLQSNSLAKPSTIHDAGPIKVKLPHARLSLLVTLIRSRSPSARRVPRG